MKQAISVAVLAAACLAFGATADAAASCLEDGIAQYRTEKFEEALELFQKCRAEQPESPVVSFYLGMSRKQSGDLPGAIGDLTAAATAPRPVVDAFLELADAYHATGEEAKALAWVQRAEEARIAPGRTAFLKGLILASQGKGDEAVQAFRRSKEADATLTQAADFQTAIVLAGSRKLAGARDALRAVVASDPNSEMASYAREYEESFTRIIESHRAWHLAVGVNYLYDDNAISNPSNAAARVQIGSPTGQEDHAFLGTLRLDYNPLLSGNYLFSGQYLVQGTKYGDGDSPSTVINSLTLIPGYAFGSSALSIPVNYSHVFLKEEKYQQLAGIRPTWSWQFAPQHILQGGVNYTRRDMLAKALSADEERDANLYGASAGVIRSFGTLGGMAALRYDFSYDDTEGANWKNAGHRVALSGIMPLSAKVKVNLAAEVLRQDYRNVNSIFDVKRSDTTWYGSTGISWTFRPHLTLSAQYSHTTVDSNIAIYGYNRNTFTTGVEFDF